MTGDLFTHEPELYKLIADTANEGIWVLDKQLLTVYVNTKITELLGYPPSEMHHRTLSEFLSDGTEIPSEMNDPIAPSPIESRELPLLSKTGKEVWVSANARPIQLKSTSGGWLLMMSDISEARRHAEELQENRLNYTSLFEDIPVPIWDEDFSQIKIYLDQKKAEGITDFKTYFTENPERLEECTSLLIVNDINQAVVELNEASSKEEVLEGFRKMLTRKSAEYAIEQLVAIAENRTSCEFDAELLTFGNNIRYVHFRWTVVKGHEDTYKRVFLSTTDLTRRIIDENLALQHSNREKAVLLREIHHRVKNNLQIITSLLNLQSHGIEDEEMRSVFEMSLNRIKAMASVHEMLYRSNDFSGINYREYLDTLVNSLVESFKGYQHSIKVHLDVGNIVLNINTSIPLGLLINELITNSLKHGIKGDTPGEVYLEMQAIDGNEFLLKIGDNGVGIPEHTDIYDTDTLGLQLVTSLVQQLSGSIRMDFSRPGTHFEIRFCELETHHDGPTS